MNTAKRVIGFHYTLTDKSGEVIDTSRDSSPFTFLEGSSQVIPGLEKALTFLNVGDQKKIEIPANEAYGELDEQLIIELPLTKLPNAEQVQVGDQFQASGPQNEMLLFRVIELIGENAKLDGNHPLAGEDLTFDIEITSIRDATAEEMAHGHPHGEGGHHH